MADFVYTTVAGKIAALLAKVREVGVPAKVTNQWLKSIGFKSSNDGSLIGVLKQVGLADPSGVPTPLWSQYRGTAHKAVLADGIRRGYQELFATYPDAPTRSNTDLEHVFATSTNGGKKVIALTVNTFKNLCAQADFSAETQLSAALNVSTDALHAPVGGLPIRSVQPAANNEPSVHIDIQVHIAADTSVEQIDQIFKSMGQHLYGRPVSG